MAKALAEIATMPHLIAAWQNLFTQSRTRSRNGFGIDGESLNQFKERERENLRSLSGQIHHESFQFSALKANLVPKPNGKGFRVICVPTVRDRIVQRALLDYLSRRYMQDGQAHSRKLMNPVSFGFLRGRTVQQAVGYACQMRNANPWVYKTDIASFFDQISRADLRVSIVKHVKQKTLHKLLFAAAECEIDESKRTTRDELKKKGIKPGRGVRQGMPLSPLFANLLMIEFDRGIHRKKIKALRYADDLIFFANSESICLEYHEYCIRELTPLGLTIPDIGDASKSQIFSPIQVSEFLGVGIALQDNKYRSVVTSRQFDVMRNKFLALGDVKQLVDRRISLATFGGILDSTVDGYLSCYDFCDNRQEVDDQLGAYRELAIKNLLRDGLKVELGLLGKDARAFVGF